MIRLSGEDYVDWRQCVLWVGIFKAIRYGPGLWLSLVEYYNPLVEVAGPMVGLIAACVFLYAVLEMFYEIASTNRVLLILILFAGGDMGFVYGVNRVYLLLIPLLSGG